MNKKFLFGMLVSGAMLAACTAEDDLNLAKVNKGVNPEAPVFVVSFEGEDLQNRAVYTNNQVNFQTTDLLSLYHGSKANASSAAASFTGYGNAIYRGSVTNEQFIFSTEAMVKSGKAIMVYPADTTGVWETNESSGLYITIKDKQPKGYAELTPYMSEVITLGANTGHVENQDEAGYGRQYDINLRRAAGTILMTLNRHGELVMPEGVDPIDFKNVTLGAGVYQASGDEKLFTSKVEVKVGTDASVARVEDNNKPANNKHLTWQNQSMLDENGIDADEGYSEITTEDIDGNVARFTLLPTKTGQLANRGYVTVATRYGTVTMDGITANDKWWSDKVTTFSGRAKNYEGDSATIGFGLRAFFEKVAYDNATSGTYFKDANNSEKVGKFVNVGLHLEMTRLDMDGLHIKDEKHLRDAIAVFNANFDKKTEAGAVNAVKFILEGDEDGKFVMTKATWEAVVAQLAKNATTTKNSSIVFAPCDEKGKVCTAVVLDSKDAAEEVPALQFELHENHADTSDSDYAGLNLELKSKGWTYASGAWSSTASSNKGKNITGIKEIHVLDGAVLTATGEYVSIADQTPAYTTAMALVIDEGGELDVKTKVFFEIDMVNKGTINITDKGELLMSSVGTTAKTLKNWAQEEQYPGGDNKKAQITGLTNKYGTINNYYALGVNENQNTKSTIVNYGYIYVKDAEARTFVTVNAADNFSFATEYYGTAGSGNNLIGTIVLLNPTGNKKTTIEEESTHKGFVKCTINATNASKDEPGVPTYKDFGGDDYFANYFVLGDDVTDIKYTPAPSGGKPAYLPTNTGIYIETSHNVNLDGNLTLLGLVVKDDAVVDVLKNNTVDVACFYIKGSVYASGALTDGASGKTYVQNGYFGNGGGTIAGPGSK